MEAKKYRMKNWIFIWGSLFLTSCYSASPAMTGEKFANVSIGEPVSYVIEKNGTPYSIETRDGIKEYTYIERVNNGNQLIYENHFILYVQNGIIVGKTTRQEKRPPYEVMYQDDPNHVDYP